MKTIFLTVACLWIGLAAHAQASERDATVELLNGSKLYGVVTHLDSAGYVVMYASGVRMAILPSRIASMEFSNTTLRPEPEFTKGLWSSLEFGPQFTGVSNAWWNSDPRSAGAFTLGMTMGYQLNRFIRFGLRFGMEMHGDRPMGLPLTAEFMTVPLKSRQSPYFGARIGYGFMAGRWWGGEDLRGGFRVGLEGGVRFTGRKNARTAKRLFLAYNRGNTVEVNPRNPWEWPPAPVPTTKSVRRWTHHHFTTGFAFEF